MASRLARWGIVASLFVTACAGGGEGEIIEVDSGIDSGLDAGFDAGPVDQGVDLGRPDAGPPEDSTGVACVTADDCFGPDLCTNAQACRNNRCVVVGGPATCDDGYACTNDSCDPVRGRCVHTPDDMRCPGDQFCAVGSGCVRELPCEVGDLTCARLNGDPCTGTWSCEPARLRCVRSAPYNCDDSDTCTTDVCMVMGTAPTCLHNGPDYQSDAMNCGACGNACAAGPNQTATCAMGACAYACAMGYVDLDRNPMNGCECNAAAVDEPDLMFTDTNCDGIDGDPTRAVFVSPRGDDMNDGSMMSPKRTLAAAIALAAMSTPPRSVYAALGSYSESVTVVSGVSIYGGYDDTRMWSRGNSNTTVISGGATAVLANGISTDTELQLLTIQARDGAMPGDSSYGVRVVGSTARVLLRGCSISAGNGASGGDGPDGSDGANGGNGTNASGATPGGGGGSSCGATGGGGGAGVSGTNDGNRGGNGNPFGPGLPGGAGGSAGTQGGGCCSSSGDTGRPAPNDARPGLAGGGGNNGRAGTALGSVGGDGVYAPAAGTAGTDGGNGGGGGGGGSGGGDRNGCPFSCSSGTSGGGGGGGGGGCGGLGGAGGRSGGGSFAVM
ncbi:MAG: hypothetical protein R3A52_01890, partial [Polyangiales bacterium]